VSLRTLQHLVEHRLGQAAGEGVLLARVVAAEQDLAAWQLGRGAMSEARLGADRSVQAQRRVPGEAAERDDHADRAQQL
jgi:hypothetical protein